MQEIHIAGSVDVIAQPGGNGSDGHGWSRQSPFMREVERSFDAASQEGSELSVVVAGLDGFRMVTDVLGPIEGDAVLAAFAACVGGSVEQMAHLDGDQLIALLPGVDAPGAVVLAEALREEVAASILTTMGKLTASFGVAVYPDSVQSADELVYGAQAAMYWAKTRGGNSVGYWGELIGSGGWKRLGAPTDPVAALTAALERKIRAGSGTLARSAWYAGRVAKEMGVGTQEREIVEKAALLHDVGKLAISDEILQKPGSLGGPERELVKAHPLAGVKIVRRVEELAGAAPIIAHHHEHFDGSGYPDGLVGDAIPLGSRIILVSDAFDAMTTYRSYKSVVSLRDALQELHRCSGQQFDRRVVEAFIAIVSRQGLNALHWSQSRRWANRT